jgi:hypothetical protein
MKIYLLLLTLLFGMRSMSQIPDVRLREADSLYQALVTAYGIHHQLQRDSLRKAIEATWFTNNTDGRMYHQLSPPGNIATAGIHQQESAFYRRDALWLKLAGLAAGGLMYTQNKTVGLVIGGAAVSYSWILDFRSTRSQGESGHMLKSGYSIHEKYDLLPDSIADGDRSYLILRRFRRVMK